MLRVRVRSTAGRLGSCLVVLYPRGIQVCMVSVGTTFSSTRQFVRLIRARPRMAFFFGNARFMKRGTQVVIEVPMPARRDYDQ